jgi:hypothetical protein
MSERRGLLADISWFQVLASVLAAVTAAWLASRLGVAGTMIGVALGSFVATTSSAVYGRTLDKGKTLIVQTAGGTTLQKPVREGEIAEALQEAADVSHSPVARAEIVEDAPRRLRWKTIVVTTVVVALTALGLITAYELVSDRTLDGSGGTTIGDTFGGSRGKPDPTPTPTPTATTDEPSPRPTRTTAVPAPTRTTPTPTEAPLPTATPTPTAAPTDPTE